MKTLRLLALSATLLLGLSACSAPHAPAQSSPAQSSPAQTELGAATEGITVGDGPVLIELWTDLSCPHCAALEEGTGADLEAAVADGTVTLTIHPMNYVSAKRGDATAYSTRAANLLALVAATGEHEAILPLYALLQANQVDAQGAPTDEQLLAFAQEAGVAADVSAGVTGRTMFDWVQQSNDSWHGQVVGSGTAVDHVPLLVVGGDTFEVREDGTDPQRLRDTLG